MWCFVAGSPDDNARRQLQRAGVGVFDYAVEMYGVARAGITFPEEQLANVLSCLGLEEHSRTELHDTDVPLMINTRGVVDYSQPIAIEDGPLAHQNEVVLTLMKFESRLKLKYAIRDCGRRRSGLATLPNCLSIRFDSFPDSIPVEVVGSQQGGRSRVTLGAIPEDLLRIQYDEGHLIALFQGSRSSGTLWIMSNLLGAPELTEYLEFILHNLCAHLGYGGKAGMWRDFTHTLDRSRYIEMCRERLQTERQTSTSDLQNAESGLEELQARYIRAMRFLETTRRFQRELQEGTPRAEARMLEQLGHEYDTLVDHPQVESFELTDSWLKVQTGAIEINYNGRVYAMGKYTITVSIVSGTIDIKGGKPHPHVYDTGKPCLATHTEQITKLIARRKFDDLIPWLIRFLELYNDQSPVPGREL